MAVHVCVEKSIPQALMLEAAERAIDENPENEPSGTLNVEQKLGVAGRADETFGAVLTGKKWKNGRLLRVRHLDSNAAIRKKVEKYAKQWEAFANITFEFVAKGDAEIRISYQLDNESWSYIGTDALTIPVEQETMHYGWLKPNTNDEEVRRVVLHEFGHALGMIHEHQHPEVEIHWNKDAVYDHFAQQGWSKATVDSNLFAAFTTDETQFDSYDPKSIMHYPIPPEFTTDGIAVGWNTELSNIDKKFIARVYPKSAPAAAAPPPGIARTARSKGRKKRLKVAWPKA